MKRHSIEDWLWNPSNSRTSTSMSRFFFMTCHVTVTIHNHDPRWCPVERVKLFITFLYKVFWGVTHQQRSASASSQVPNTGKLNEVRGRRPGASIVSRYLKSSFWYGFSNSTIFPRDMNNANYGCCLKFLFGRRCVHSCLCERWQRLLKKPPMAVFSQPKNCRGRVELVKGEYSKVNSLQKQMGGQSFSWVDSQ